MGCVMAKKLNNMELILPASRSHFLGLLIRKLNENALILK